MTNRDTAQLAARPLLTVLLSSDLEDQRPQADDLNSFSSRNLEMLLVEFEQVLHAQNVCRLGMINLVRHHLMDQLLTKTSEADIGGWDTEY